ncbi:FG-GAP repeat domain-containing protein [Streptomyces sp. NPDC048258]|uniref:FG-GAP repeat domain-containing protein n=1 Tax=Streptomyces sp. NPDC048258 TaxID=3365527 RepID=UPI0037145073
MLQTMNRSARRAVIGAIGLVLAAVAVGVSGAAPPLWGDRTANAGSIGAQPVGPPLKTFPLLARNASTGKLRAYEPNGTGGLKSAYELGGGFGDATALVQANVSEGGRGNDLYHRAAGTLYYTAEHGNDTKVVGGGWDIYNTIVSVGNMGGSADVDLIARDAAGDLWLYQGKPDGTLAARIRVGTGWNGMTLVGRGDYTGDGKPDVLARSSDGTLTIYAGTGAATVDAVVGTRYVVGTGWEAYKTLASAGDTDGDGKTDLIGADTAGALWLFKGTGNAAAPFAPRVQIGTSGWAAFDVLF